jgi:hypothetical protein
MYQTDTILTLKTPRWRPLVDGEPGDWQTENYDKFQADTEKLKPGAAPVGEEFPYNRVRVVGVSPVVHSGRDGGQWVGASGQGVIIQPMAGFDSNVDYPLGFIQSKYDVESEPVLADPRDTVYGLPREYTRVDLGRSTAPTPEEVFAKEAPSTEAPKPKPDVADPLGAAAEARRQAAKVSGPLGDL